MAPASKSLLPAVRVQQPHDLRGQHGGRGAGPGERDHPGGHLPREDGPGRPPGAGQSKGVTREGSDQKIR